MPKTTKSLRSRNERLRLELENARMQREIDKHERVKAYYDAVTGSGGAAGTGNKRRQSRVETREEDGACGILRPHDRLSGLNLSRDTVRNYSAAKSIMHQIRVNVVGPSPKMQILLGEDGKKFADEASDWVNKRWMRRCDYRSTRHFGVLANLALEAKFRDSDFLVAFDHELRNTGRLIFFESDQICDITDLNRVKGFDDWCQRDGVIYDKHGREIGYATTHKRGQTTVGAEHAVVWRRDPEAKSEFDNHVSMVRSWFRLDQARGTSPMLTAVQDLLDSYEMKSKELQTAKVQAALAATVKRTEAIKDFNDERFDPDADNPEEEDISTTLPEEQTTPANYDRMEALTGGYTEYLAPDDEMNLLDINRPNADMAGFLDFVGDGAGSAFGLAHAYARLKAESSYTAFRGDMVLTWVTFYAMQKEFEHEFLDPVGVWAVRYGIESGEITTPAPEGWEDYVSWALPTMPFIDEGKERDAQAKGIKAGTTNYAKMLGPNWQGVFSQLSDELEVARRLGLPLDAFESKAGAVEPTQTEGTDTDEQD